jgi:hypothetical protein
MQKVLTANWSNLPGAEKSGQIYVADDLLDNGNIPVGMVVQTSSPAIT